jgi:hypothetical protein
LTTQCPVLQKSRKIGHRNETTDCDRTTFLCFFSLFRQLTFFYFDLKTSKTISL